MRWPSTVERFRSSFTIDEENGCWLWNKSLNHRGYGTFFVGKATGAHRFSFQSFYHQIPVGLVIDHVCRVRNCVNPTHLRLSTHRENIMNGEGVAVSNAAKTRCKNGHPFNVENTYVWRGLRSCRTCHRKHTSKGKL